MFSKNTSRRVLLALLCTAVVATSSLAAPISPKARIKEATKAVQLMSRSDSASDFASNLRDAVGVVIFPSVKQAGLIVGGQYGEGLLLRRDPATGRWYGPSFFSIGGASVGLQIGVASSAVILTVNTEEGLQAFRGNTFKIGADVMAAAGPGGRSASVGTDINARAPLYTYAITKGAFAGVSLSGSVVNVLPKMNRRYWGKTMTTSEIWRRPASSDTIKPLVNELNRLIRKAQ